MRSRIFSDKRLKIVITPDDLKPYGLNLHNIDCHNTDVQDSLKKIIHNAIVESHFKLNSNIFFLEMIPSSDGGGVLYLTESEQFAGKITSLFDRQETESIYCFDDFENLIGAAKSIQSLLAAKCTSDSLYVLHGKYYLKCKVFGSAKDMHTLLTQYNAYIPRSYNKAELDEHGKCLIEKDAIDTVLRFFA